MAGKYDALDVRQADGMSLPASMPPACRVYASIKDLPQSYDNLFRAAGDENPFSAREWYECFERHLVAAAQVRYYGVEGTGDPAVPLALVPMRAEVGVRYGRRLCAMSNYYTSLFEPVLAPNCGGVSDVYAAFIDTITREVPAPDEVDLHPLAVDSAQYAALVDAFRHRRMLVEEYFCFGNWYLDVAGRTYADYFADLPSKLRNTVRRKMKQFGSQDGARISIARTPEEVDRAIVDYETVYAKSWKTVEPYPDFIRAVCRVWARLGSLRLGVAYVGEQPAAAQIWVVQGRLACIFKLAYDEQLARLSLGSVLTARLMEDVIDRDRVEQIDYLTGDDAYKRDWMSQRRERWGIRAINLATLRGVAMAAVLVSKRSVRAMIGRKVGRTST